MSERWFNKGGAVLDENRFVVAHVVGQGKDDSDARMIAASPEMLDALRAIVAAIDDEEHPDNGTALCGGLYGIAVAAIAAATGVTES